MFNDSFRIFFYLTNNLHLYGGNNDDEFPLWKPSKIKHKFLYWWKILQNKNFSHEQQFSLSAHNFFSQLLDEVEKFLLKNELDRATMSSVVVVWFLFSIRESWKKLFMCCCICCCCCFCCCWKMGARWLLFAPKYSRLRSVARCKLAYDSHMQ